MYNSKNGLPRGPPFVYTKERRLDPNHTIFENSTPKYTYSQNISQFCDLACSTFCMVLHGFLMDSLLRLFIFKKILCSSRTAHFLRWRKLGCRFKSRQWGSVHFFCFRFSFFHRMFTLCLVSVLTADPFLASRDFCVNVFLDYLSLFIHIIGPKYDRETKLISNLIS